jgi:tRNA modification GTPase
VSGEPSSAAGVFRQLTPPGDGGIAVFSVEGPGARAALRAAVDSRRLADLPPGGLALGRLLSADGAVLDEVIVAALPPRGRDERFELNCHAGGAAAAAAAARLAELGLAPAASPEDREPSPAEADFLEALGAVRTRRQLAALGAERAALGGVLGRAARLLSSPGGGAAAAELLGEILEEGARLGRLLATHRAVLAGPASAGKSTLLNRLVGADRAIVSPHPGTTRDAVVALAVLRGLCVELLDTAGLGAGGDDPLARAARERSLERSAGAELLLVVIDGSAPLPAGGLAELAAPPGAGGALVVLNKSDLGTRCEAGELGEWARTPRLAVSALTGEGIPALLEAVEKALLGPPPRLTGAALGRRVRSRLERAYTCARRSAVENDRAPAEEAAGIVGSLLEAPG